MILGWAAEKIVEAHENDRVVGVMVMIDRASSSPQAQGEARREGPACQEGLSKLEGMLVSAGFEVWEESRTNLPTSRLASSRSARAPRGSRRSPAIRLGSSRAQGRRLKQRTRTLPRTMSVATLTIEPPHFLRGPPNERVPHNPQPERLVRSAGV